MKGIIKPNAELQRLAEHGNAKAMHEWQLRMAQLKRRKIGQEQQRNHTADLAALREQRIY